HQSSTRHHPTQHAATRSRWVLLRQRRSRRQARASSGFPSDGLEIRLAARRKLVADFEALSQAEALELAHVHFERIALASEFLGENARPHLRVLLDQTQRLERPGGIPVQARQLLADGLHVVWGELIFQGYRNPVAVTTVMQRDSKQLGAFIEFALSGQVLDELCARRKAGPPRVLARDVLELDAAHLVHLEDPDRVAAIAAADLDASLVPAPERQRDLTAD